MQTKTRPSRSPNPGMFWTRKDAVTRAAARAERDVTGSDWYVVGSGRRWGIVTRRPNGYFVGPIRSDNASKYRRWYSGA